jgi:hypothetical protein
MQAGSSSSSISPSDTTRTRDTAAASTLQMHQQQQQQGVPSGTLAPGARSPISGSRTPRSPIKASPFSVRQHQEIVAEELLQQKLKSRAAKLLQQQRQQGHAQLPAAAAAAAAESPHAVRLCERRPSTSDQANVQHEQLGSAHHSISSSSSAEQQHLLPLFSRNAAAAAPGNAATMLDGSGLPAMPGLKVKTGAKDKAAFGAAPAVHIQQQQQQQQQWADQERLPSLEHWSSDLAFVPAASAAAGGGSSTSMPANIQHGSPPSLQQQQQRKPPAARLPPKSPQPPSAAAAAGALNGLPLLSLNSSSSAGGNSINPFMSAGGFSGTGVGSSGLLFGSGSISSHSNHQMAPHTSPGMARTVPSFDGMALQQAMGAGDSSSSSSGGRRSGATSGAASHSVAASAPNLAVPGGEHSSPFERQQLLQRKELFLQDKVTAAPLPAVESDEADEAWEVLPVMLSPLRIPSYQQRPTVANDGSSSPTPPSPKASVTGVSNSVINMMLSEEGIPLVPTNNSDSDSDSAGNRRRSRSFAQDLFAGTPRAYRTSASFSHSSSVKARHHAVAVSGTPRAASFSGSHAAAAAAAAAAAFGGSAAHVRMGLTSASHSSSNTSSSGGYSGLQPSRYNSRRSTGSGSYAYARYSGSGSGSNANVMGRAAVAD